MNVTLGSGRFNPENLLRGTQAALRPSQSALFRYLDGGDGVLTRVVGISKSS